MNELVGLWRQHLRLPVEAEEEFCDHYLSVAKESEVQVLWEV